MSIPGFGPDISAKVIGALGDPYRFENHRQVLKLAGLDLSRRIGAERGRSRIPVISKKGKPTSATASTRLRSSPPPKIDSSLTYFTNKLKGREKRREGMKMRIKLAAKLLVIAWTLMKKKGGIQSGVA